MRKFAVISKALDAISGRRLDVFVIGGASTNYRSTGPNKPTYLRRRKLVRFDPFAQLRRTSDS